MSLNFALSYHNKLYFYNLYYFVTCHSKR